MAAEEGVRVAAVDLGASSGRVMLAEVGADRFRMTEVARFPNGPVRLGGTLHWDVLGLYRGILEGLRAAGPRLDSVGIDSWAVDHGLLDASGALLGNPVHYRDARTVGIADRVHRSVPAEELYAANGVQVLAFNTLYQLAAASGSPQYAAARTLLLIPDLLGYWLTGRRVTEATNASTTGMLDPRTRDWSDQVLARTGIDPGLFTRIVEAGSVVGELAPHVVEECGLAAPTPVVAVGSHDTASAVAAVPARDDRFAFVATGTWSLAGVELQAPVLSERGRAANFSNELGVDGTVRYLRNIMGLWLLQECLREWGSPELAPLLDAAAQVAGPGPVVDAAAPEFLAPGGMPDRIAAACARLGRHPPEGRAAMVRCVLDSLALAHRRTIREAASLSGKEVDTVHIVGGGARNDLLCRLTADACGLPVVAGPIEAAATGNALIQARALGAVTGGRAELRALLRSTQHLAYYEPAGDPRAWDSAERALHG